MSPGHHQADWKQKKEKLAILHFKYILRYPDWCYCCKDFYSRDFTLTVLTVSSALSFMTHW